MNQNVVKQLIEHLVESGRLKPDEADALFQEVSSKSDPARELASRKLLTDFQLTALEKGEIRSLSIGNYLIVDKLGHGGMGVVFLAQHRRMKRVVALKVLPPSLTQQLSSLQRFQREVETLARMQHPNIAMAFDADYADDMYYLAMEYVQGMNLQALVRARGPLPCVEAINIVDQASKGLSYAHRHGVIHRDVKPSNLVLSGENIVKVLDLGLARLISNMQEVEGEMTDVDLTSANAIMGTTAYMSPEQAVNSKTVDARSDIYSLGCTLYYLLSGKTMYGGSGSVENILAHHHEAAPSLHCRRDDVPPELETIYRMMVAKRPADRFQTMDDVRAAIEASFPHATADDLPYTLRYQPAEVPASDAPAPRDSTTVNMLRTPDHAGRRTGKILAALCLVAFVAAIVYLRNNDSPGSVPVVPLVPTPIDVPPLIASEFKVDPAQLVWMEEVLLSKNGKSVFLFGGRNDLREGARFPVLHCQREGGRVVQVFDEPVNWCWAGALSADERWLAVGSGPPHTRSPRRHSGAKESYVYVYDLEAGRLQTEFRKHSEAVRAVAFFPHSDELVTGGYDNQILQWSARTGELIHEYANDDGEVYCLAVSHDGRQIISGHFHRSVLREANSDLVVQSYPVEKTVCAAFSPDGRRLALGCAGGHIALVDLKSGAVVKELAGHTNDVNRLAWLPDGKHLLSVSADKSVRYWSLEGTITSCELVSDFGEAKGVAVLSDGYTAVTCTSAGKVTNWDLRGLPQKCP
jgi:serine/threonine protein kinase